MLVFRACNPALFDCYAQLVNYLDETRLRCTKPQRSLQDVSADFVSNPGGTLVELPSSCINLLEICVVVVVIYCHLKT